MFDLIDTNLFPTIEFRQKTESQSRARHLDNFFADASTIPFPTTWNYPDTLRPVAELLAKGVGCKDTLVGFEPDTQVVRQEKDSGRALIGFSGGKDGVASTIVLKAEGYDVTLFYVQGINKAYPKEMSAAQELAHELKVPIIIHTVRVSGKAGYIENPFKNQYILGQMIEHGVRHNMATFAQGNLLCDTVEKQAFGSGYSDSIEMYDAMNEYGASQIPNYEFLSLLKNDTDSLLTVIGHDPGLLEYIHSCMLPIRYKGNIVSTNTKKYGVKLYPNECGSCYKCCARWLILEMIGQEKKNEGFKDHCYDVLVTALARIQGGGPYTRFDVDAAFFDKNLLNSYK